jgi:hypothetical protein
MLRAIIRYDIKDPISGAVSTTFGTVDFDAPTLQKRLTGGGMDELGYDIPTLIGIEVLADT